MNMGVQDFKQCIRYTFGLAIYAMATYCLVEIRLGLAPWEILAKGISLHCPLSFGQVIITISITLFIIDVFLKEKIGLGMILDALLVGVFVDLFTWLDLLPKVDSLVGRIGIYIVCLFIMGYAMYLCMSAGQGMGPRDTLLVGLGRRVRRIPIGAVQAAMLITVFLIGWALGGPVGIGTVISVIAMGPILQLYCQLFHFEPRDVVHKSLLDYVR